MSNDRVTNTTQAEPTRLQDEFDSLAQSSWQALVRKSENDTKPVLPTLENIQEALIEGELDDGMPEFRKRLDEALALLRANEKPPTQVFLSKNNTHLDVVVNGVKKELDSSLINRTDEIITAYSLPEYHDTWTAAMRKDDSLKHPLAPLIVAWFNRPLAIRPSNSRAGVIPSSMEGMRGQVYLPGLAPVESALGEQDALVMLPGFASFEDSIIPTSLIATWKAGGGHAKGRGQGAPLGMRSFFEFLTMARYSDRRVGKRLRIEMTLKQYRDIHYSIQKSGRSTFKTKQDLNKVLAALKEVDEMRVRAVLPGYDVPTRWRPINITAMPEADLGSPIVADVELPPGSARGAMIDRHALRFFGRKSAIQYVAALGLAYYWDRYGTHSKSKRPIMATRPLIARSTQGLAIGTDGDVLLNNQRKPITGFSDNRLVFLDTEGNKVDGANVAERRRMAARERNPAADRYPILRNYDLLMLCYPEDAGELAGNISRQRLHRSKEALSSMEQRGYCIIERLEGSLGEEAYRILPTSWDNFKSPV